MTVGLGVEFFGDRLMVGVDDVDDDVLAGGGVFPVGNSVGVADTLFLAHTFAAAFSASHPASTMS